MSVQPDPQLVREIAATAIRLITSDMSRSRLAQCAIAVHGIDEHDIRTWSAYYDDVIAAIGSATVTVTWPDEQSQAERDDDVRAVAALLQAVKDDYEINRQWLGAFGTRALSALEQHFASRIVALDAHTTDGGTS